MPKLRRMIEFNKAQVIQNELENSNPAEDNPKDRASNNSISGRSSSPDSAADSGSSSSSEEFYSPKSEPEPKEDIASPSSQRVRPQISFVTAGGSSRQDRIEHNAKNLKNSLRNLQEIESEFKEADLLPRDNKNRQTLAKERKKAFKQVKRSAEALNKIEEELVESLPDEVFDEANRRTNFGRSKSNILEPEYGKLIESFPENARESLKDADDLLSMNEVLSEYDLKAEKIENEVKFNSKINGAENLVSAYENMLEELPESTKSSRAFKRYTDEIGSKIEKAEETGDKNLHVQSLTKLTKFIEKIWDMKGPSVEDKIKFQSTAELFNQKVETSLKSVSIHKDPEFSPAKSAGGAGILKKPSKENESSKDDMTKAYEDFHRAMSKNFIQNTDFDKDPQAEKAGAASTPGSNREQEAAGNFAAVESKSEMEEQEDRRQGAAADRNKKVLSGKLQDIKANLSDQNLPQTKKNARIKQDFEWVRQSMAKLFENNHPTESREIKSRGDNSVKPSEAALNPLKTREGVQKDPRGEVSASMNNFQRELEKNSPGKEGNRNTEKLRERRERDFGNGKGI